MKLEKTLQYSIEAEKLGLNLDIALLGSIDTYDSDKWDNLLTEVEFAINSLITSTDLLFDVYNKRGLLLGQTAPKISPIIIKPVSKYDYFITIAFPNKGAKFHAFKTDFFKHKAILGHWEWNELKQNDQHKYICHIFRHYKHFFKHLHLFFEQTIQHEVHVHMRCTFNDIKNIKDVKCFFYQMFNLSISKYPRFLHTRMYIDDKWNNYDVKVSKQYQNLNYEPLIFSKDG